MYWSNFWNKQLILSIPLGIFFGTFFWTERRASCVTIGKSKSPIGTPKFQSPGHNSTIRTRNNSFVWTEIGSASNKKFIHRPWLQWEGSVELIVSIRYAANFPNKIKFQLDRVSWGSRPDSNYIVICKLDISRISGYWIYGFAHVLRIDCREYTRIKTNVFSLSINSSLLYRFWSITDEMWSSFFFKPK